jgi:hypothetical protein
MSHYIAFVMLVTILCLEKLGTLATILVTINLSFCATSLWLKKPKNETFNYNFGFGFTLFLIMSLAGYAWYAYFYYLSSFVEVV